MKQNFILNNLECANCAARIEEAISKMDGVKNVNFNFVLKKLTLDTETTNIKEEIQKICDHIEDGVKVSDYAEHSSRQHDKDSKTESSCRDEYHHHKDCCDTDKSCGNETEHHHSDEQNNAPIWTMIVALLLELVAIGLSLFWQTDLQIKKIIILVATIISALLSGHKVLISGIKNILHLSFEESSLMTIAVIPAFIIGEYVEAAMVTLLFAVGEIIEDKAVDKSRADIEKLANIRADQATVLTDPFDETTEIVVEADKVEVGSIVVIKPFQRVPVDGTVIKGSTLLDNSALTGESIPQEVSVGDQVLSGAVNGGNLIYIKCTVASSDSTASRILALIENAAGKKSNGEKIVNRFAKIYTPVVIAIAVILAVVPPLFGLGTFKTWLYRALICLVASCPCSIVISVPLAYFSSIGRASKFGALVKGARYLEILSKIDAIVFDKTGTLTTDEISVTEVKSFCQEYTDSDVLNLAATLDKNSTHPIAVALCKNATNMNKYILAQYSELSGFGVQATLDGKLCKLGSRKILNETDAATYEGYNVYLIIDDKLIGAIKLSDTIRGEAENVLAELKSLGINKQIMLSGANENEVQLVADELHLTNAYSNLLPEDKLTKLDEIKNSAKSVAFVGDGINDGPVLASSDCGVAMGFGSDTAIESADVVLSRGDLSPLPSLIKLSRATVSTVITNIALSISVKALVIILASLGLAQMWMGVVADTGLCAVCVAYTSRLLRWKK